jgi:hypothetical protein
MRSILFCSGVSTVADWSCCGGFVVSGSFAMGIVSCSLHFQSIRQILAFRGDLYQRLGHWRALIENEEE